MKAVLKQCGILAVVYAVLTGWAQARTEETKKEIRCYWMGSSSSPMRLLKTFDEFVNAGKGYSIKGSVMGSSVRLDQLASGDEKAKPVKLNGVNKGDYDYVIVQVSMGFVRSQKAIEGMGDVVGDLCKQVRALGAEPVLWEAYAATPDRASGMNTVQMQDLLHKELLKVAALNKAIFVPAGSPWQEVRMSRPAERLYMFSKVAPNDVGHTGPRGNFILGAAIYAAVTGENPVENPNLTTYDMDAAQTNKASLWATLTPFPMDPTEAAHFKEVVWKHDLKAREEYRALDGKFVESPRLNTTSGSAGTATPASSVKSVVPKAELFDIYLLMGRQSVVAKPDPARGADKRIFVLDAESGEWRPYRPETDGDGGLGALLVAKSPGRSVGLIFCGMDGSSVEDWGSGKKNYQAAMRAAQNALRQGTLWGCFWLSATADDDAHNPAFLKMTADFRDEVPAQDLPFMTGNDAGKMMEGLKK